MANTRSSSKSRKIRVFRQLRVSLDEESKEYLVKASALRHISISDYVRTVTVAQARKEVHAAREQTLTLTPEEQLAFWNALNETPKLTAAQRRLGKIMRREA